MAEDNLINQKLASPTMQRLRAIREREATLAAEGKQPLKFLVIDQARVFRLQVIRPLASLGAEVIVDEADNGWQAMQLIESVAGYRCIFIELMIPGFTGWEVVEKLRERGSKIPVVAVTFEKERESIDRATAEGLAAYILKPAPPERLLKIVQDILHPAGS